MVKTVSPIFRKLFQAVKDPVLILNTSCQIESINDYAAQLLNINSTIKQQLPLDEHSEIQWSSFVDKIQMDMGGFCVLNVKTSDDQFRKVKLVGYYHEKKKLIFARIGLIHDEGVKKTSKVDTSVFSMINDIPHGVILTSISGEVIDLNELASNYIECEKCEIINSQHETVFNYFVDYDYCKLQYFANLMNNGRASINVSRTNRFGEELFFKLESKFNYKMSMIVTTITDETEIVKLKQQLDQQNSLNALGQMAASIAHEIRNPMTSLKGFVELLKINSTDDGYKYLSVMDSELHRMDTILSELLYLSKPKERHFEKLSFTQLVDEVVELMLPHAVHHNITLKSEQHDNYCTKIIGNDNRLKQMLINLVKNAIESMSTGGKITISIKNKDSYIQVAVKDEGAGIPDVEQKNLFKPFYTTKETGTGLGLALVKKVVEEHNGTISVESTIGYGTTFIINLPFCEKIRHTQDEDDFINYWNSRDSVKNIPVV
ncbi:two-component system, sporulation sensor kinase E [Ureibacillus xyleni]|uniref:histidine kinase n=1 Tax=Ureibacillus xyleni TaxID=614648 RepID=A0A285RCL6_9BACL|nr:ATP-binding protein [Ureibacillus xyleni]SOB91853.1 two-component system, sporulation sensor kinase E [Ureibacillus xyleni]